MSMRSCPRWPGLTPWTLMATIVPLLLHMSLSNSLDAAETLPPDPEDRCLESLAGVHQPNPKQSREAVEQFVRAVHSDECRRSLEFEEWSTETIYDLMQDAPETFFTVLMQAPPPVQASVITALDHPADQFIDYAAIYESISTGVRDKRLRDYALRIFTPHYQRYLKEQKEWERLETPKGKARQG